MAGQERIIKSDELGPEELKLRVVNQDNVETMFKLKQNTHMSKLMNSYCTQVGIQRGSVRFMYNGVRLGDEETPKQLEMENEDVIDAMVEQLGGALPDSSGSDPNISIRVVGSKKIHCFLMRRTDKLEHLMTYCCARENIDKRTAKFTFKGKMLYSDQTPAEVGCSDACAILDIATCRPVFVDPHIRVIKTVDHQKDLLCLPVDPTQPLASLAYELTKTSASARGTMLVWDGVPLDLNMSMDNLEMDTTAIIDAAFVM